MQPQFTYLVLFFFKVLVGFFFCVVRVLILCLHAVPSEARRRRWIPWDWSSTDGQEPPCESGNWTWVPCASANAPNCWAASPVLGVSTLGISHVLCHQVILCVWMSPRCVTVFWCSDSYLPSQHKGGRGKQTVTDLRPSLITWEVAGQHRLQCETVSQKKNKQEEWMTWFYRLNNKTKIETRSRLTVTFFF